MNKLVFKLKPNKANLKLLKYIRAFRNSQTKPYSPRILKTKLAFALALFHVFREIIQCNIYINTT